MFIASLSPAVKAQTNIDPGRGGMEERRKRVSVHAACWLHRIVISKAPPPTTLTPVAEKNVNSCMAGGRKLYEGTKRRGEELTSNAKQLQTKNSTIVEFYAGPEGSWHMLTQTYTVRHKAGKVRQTRQRKS